MRQPLPELELQRVVLGVAAVADDLGAAEIVGVGDEEIRRDAGARSVGTPRRVVNQRARVLSCW